MAGLNGRDPEYIANIVVDAYALGETGAAKRHGISRSTVSRHKVRAKADPALTALIQAKIAECSSDLGVLRVQFLRKALAAAEEKLAGASLYETAGAIKIVGELHATAMMIGDDNELQPDAASEDPAETEGGGGSVPSGTDSEASARH